MSAADPLHARDLVVEDALHSRGLVLDDRELLDEQHDLEEDLRQRRGSLDRKGKGRATQDGDGHQDRRILLEGGEAGHVDDDAEDVDEDGYLDNNRSNSGTRADRTGNSSMGEDIPLHHRHRRRRSSPHSPLSPTDPTLKRAPAGGRRAAGGRARSGSMLGGLLEKNQLPEAGTSKRELRSMYVRRIAINVLFIMAW